MGKTIGIDLGTTNTCAAVVEQGRPRVLVSGLGYSTIPSVVTFDDRGEPVVGQPAMRRMVLQPEQTVYGSKRLLGRAFLSGVKQRFQPHFSYELVGKDGWVAARVCDRVVALTEVASLLLREIRTSAETTLRDRVDRAVVTVPAYFNDAQRACVREAGQLAELDVIRTLNEPTAAALAFGTRQTTRKKVAVFDLGGGTFDVSLVDIDGDMYEVLGVDGDTFLGGIDFDRACVKLLVDRLCERKGRELRLSRVSEERLREAVEDAKRMLSTQMDAAIQLPHLELEDGDAVDVDELLTKTELEGAVGPLVDRTLEIVARALDAVDLSPKAIDDVLLVGGQTRMPLIHRSLRSFFGREPSKRVHPDEVVAIGAAIAAVSLEREDAPVLLDVVPMSIGLGRPDGGFDIVVPKNTQVPHRTTTRLSLPAGTRRQRIPVYQGNSNVAADNAYLGTIVLDDIPDSSSELVGELRFEVSNECMLSVAVAFPSLGVEQSIELTAQMPEEPRDDPDDHRVDRVHVVEQRPAAPKSVAGGTSAAAEGRSWLSRLLAALGLRRRG